MPASMTREQSRALDRLGRLDSTLNMCPPAPFGNTAKHHTMNVRTWPRANFDTKVFKLGFNLP
eukprot:1265355-Amphidinium_carterae.1